jgi:hypothetical protein
VAETVPGHQHAAGLDAGGEARVQVAEQRRVGSRRQQVGRTEMIRERERDPEERGDARLRI